MEISSSARLRQVPLRYNKQQAGEMRTEYCRSSGLECWLVPMETVRLWNRAVAWGLACLERADQIWNCVAELGSPLALGEVRNPALDLADP
jgi:hypothetical protein